MNLKPVDCKRKVETATAVLYPLGFTHVCLGMLHVDSHRSLSDNDL